MLELANKQVLVIGLGRRGQAACELLHRSGARVTGVDQARTPDLLECADKLRPLGIEVSLGALIPPVRDYNLAVISSTLPANATLVEAVRRNKVRLISELELGSQQSHCLSIAVAGAKGRGTTAELIERVLANNHRRVALSGGRAHPVCSVIERSKELDYLILQTDASELEFADSLRPSIAVLTSVDLEPLGPLGNPDKCARVSARLFRNQQALDWAIIQKEALSRLHGLNLQVPAKKLTFSSDDPNADLCLSRGRIISRIPNRPGRLLDMVHCQLQGIDNAESLMAALAVGHVLRLPWERTVDSLKTCPARPDGFEFVAELNGVQFINDSQAANVAALSKALLAARPNASGEPNLWLITGAEGKDPDSYAIGSVLAKRVKHVFVVGEGSRRTCAAWGVFTPCTAAGSLLEAVAEAARNAASGDVVLFSPASSSWTESRRNHHCGEIFCQAVKSIGRGLPGETPNIDGRTAVTQQ